MFTIGAERNSDVVIGASYAPLLCNLNSHQWVPDLIGFTANPNETVRSTSHSVISVSRAVTPSLANTYFDTDNVRHSYFQASESQTHFLSPEMASNQDTGSLDSTRKPAHMFSRLQFTMVVVLYP